MNTIDNKYSLKLKKIKKSKKQKTDLNNTNANIEEQNPLIPTHPDDLKEMVI